VEDFTLLTTAELLERLDHLTLSIASGNSPDPAVTQAAMRTAHEMLVIIAARQNAP
jgi:hypothetical protein